MADITGMLQASSGTAAASGGWNLANADVYTDSTVAWDFSKAWGFYSFSVSGQESGPTGVFFKPDGTKMYITGTGGDDVNEYTLSTAWDVSTASFTQNFSVATEEAAPQDLFFKPDGTKMYIVGSTGDEVNEYALSTAWDISTASFTQNFSVAGQETGPNGLFFKPDGTKMYIVGSVGDDVNEYTLSTPWDISTASFVQNFSVAAQDTTPNGLSFKPDGTKMYIVGSETDSVYEYALSTAWNISTASYTGNTIATNAPQSPVDELNPQGLFFKPDGTQMFVVGSTIDSVITYYFTELKDVSSEEALPTGLFFKPDGTKMYIVGSSGDEVNEYTLSTAWDVNTASFTQAFSVAGQETGPNGLFFKPDGTKMYIIGQTGDDVNEYTLSIAWNISTASFTQNFSVAGQESIPQDLFFKPDGTKMYIVGSSSDAVNEYTLSTAWDVSTASFVQNFSVNAQDVTPTGLFFKTDGTRMYVVGSTADSVFQYTLSTPWDISTASYTGISFLLILTIFPGNIYIRDDGTKFWGVDSTKDYVFTYSM